MWTVTKREEPRLWVIAGEITGGGGGIITSESDQALRALKTRLEQDRQG